MSAPTPTPDASYVSLEYLDALFGPGWRHPYCLWPRGSARPLSSPQARDANRKRQTDRALKQMRLGEGAE